MKKVNILGFAFLVALLLVAVYTVFPVKSEARADVDIRFYGGHEQAYAALVAGDVDFIQGSVTYEQKVAVEDDPDLCISSYSENGMIEYDLNNNYTIADYPGIRNPLTVKEFRRAISCAVDKAHIVNFILKGAAGILNVPIPLNSISWWPTCALEGNYPWSYNMTKAAEQLALAGFVDIEPDGILNYPADWDGRPGQPNMDPLKVYVRTEDKRLDAGRYFCDQLDLLHIPYTKIETNSDVCYPAVMIDRNYHIYTGGWSLGRYPKFLYFGFHSEYWFPGGSNYVTGMNSSNLPNYPDYDTLAHAVYYTDSIASSQAACKLAAALGWCDYVFNIPLWSYSSFVAWRKDMPGVVNMFGYGLDNRYTFLNAYKAGGGPITMGTIAAPKALNPLYSVWHYDYAVLDRVFDSLLYVNPYDLTADQPWAVQDWEVGTWIDPNPGAGEPTEKTKVTYFLRADCGIVAPNGTYVRNLTAHDLAFSCWYTYAFSDGWNWANYQDVHHTNIIDDYAIEYYFDDASYWFYTAPQYPILPKTELIDTLCKTTSATITVSGNVTADTTYWLDCDPIVTVTSDDIPVNYTIIAGYETYTHTGISFDAVPADGTYTINYYTPDLDPHGYYLAGLDWTQTWYSAGPFHPTSITPGVGGFASLNRNMHYWMSDSPPLLGEIDWMWLWGQRDGTRPAPDQPDGPRIGSFRIDILDVNIAGGAYCHYGTGPYDPEYFPGADIDLNDLGHVGIYDQVSVTGKYGRRFAAPPSTLISDIAVVNVVSCKTVVGTGYVAYVNVTVENQGDFAEVFKVFAEANAKTIGAEMLVSDLLPGEEITFTFPWNTTGWAKGNYTLSANVPVLSYETDTADNSLVDGCIFVSIPGDVDGNRVVNIYDVVKITGIYLSEKGDSEYACNSDIDSDGIINIYDVVRCTSHYGQSW